MPSPTVVVTFTDKSTREVPAAIATRIRGLDPHGYVVIPLAGPGEPPIRGADGAEYVIPLTPCCHRDGKGGETGIVCRGCHRPVDDLFGGPTRVAVPVDAAEVAARLILAELGITGAPTALERYALCLLVEEVAATTAAEEAARVNEKGAQLAWLAARGWTTAEIRKVLNEARRNVGAEAAQQMETALAGLRAERSRG